MRSCSAIALCALVVLGATLEAENWPQWRGPSLNGVSGETGLPLRWSRTEHIAWKLELPAWSGSTRSCSTAVIRSTMVPR